MNKSNYNDELWDEIPPYAFMALGRRGREQISLRECFIPSCNSTDEDKLHPIKKEIETTQIQDKNAEIKKVKYLIHCDECSNEFHLVFEQYINNDVQNEDIEGIDIVMEKVFATDSENKENYGEIGFIQQK